jgi:glucose-1-phosphate cytidylyltransferase
VTTTQPGGRFGALNINAAGEVVSFMEKPAGDGAWINGGFFVLEPKVLDYIAGDAIMFEREPLEGLSRDNQLRAYKHDGFWQPMDTLRDKNQLEELWASGAAPWKVW